MKCIGCDATNTMKDGKTSLASFLTASGRGPRYICRECASNAGMSWARKDRADNAPKPDAPKPTNPPAGAGLAERAAQARTFNARAA